MLILLKVFPKWLVFVMMLFRFQFPCVIPPVRLRWDLAMMVRELFEFVNYSNLNIGCPQCWVRKQSFFCSLSL